MSPDRTHWLVVERLENWEVDRREGFTQFGIPDSRVSIANRIAHRDLLVFYVSSGVSCFADVREATANGIQKLRMGGQYDTAYPWKLSTRPYLILEREAWIPIQDVLHRLSFASGKGDWRQIMRNTLRHLSVNDAEVILTAMAPNTPL